MNSGIRAILRKPKYGYFPISSFRASLELETIEAIRDKIVGFEAWKQRREFMKLQSNGGMETRARKKLNLIAPDQRGWRGKKVATKIRQSWNTIPLTIKMENNAGKAKKALKIFYNDM